MSYERGDNVIVRMPTGEAEPARIIEISRGITGRPLYRVALIDQSGSIWVTSDKLIGKRDE